jgi:hypothetical protein
MISLKKFIEGFLGEILLLPIMYLRTNCFVLRRGIRGAYELERLCLRGNKDFFNLRAIAIINVILIFATAQANNSKDDGFGVFLTAAFKPDGILDTQFSRTLAAIVLMYCLYFGLARLLGKRGTSSGLFAASALYFACLSLLLYFIYFLGAFTAPGVLPYVLMENGMRFCILATYAYAFWQAGAGLASRLPRPVLTVVGRPAMALTLGALCFGVYLLSLKLCLKLHVEELVWPNLHI